MLEPRPEIRIATRLRSRMVTCGPILVRIPAAGLAVDRATSRALLDPADFEDVLDRARNRGNLARVDDYRHPDPTVEGTSHFFGCEVPALLEKLEYLG